MKKKFLTVAIAVGVTTFSMSCSNNSNNKENDDRDTPGSVADAEEHNDAKFNDQQEKDAHFISDAVQRNLVTLSMCEKAVMNNKDTVINRISKMLYEYHTKKNDELTAMAKKKNITIPTVVDSSNESYRSMNDHSGDDLRRNFIDHLVDDHKSAIDEYQKASENSADPEIRSFASNELTMLRQHLDQLMNVQDRYKNSTTENRRK